MTNTIGPVDASKIPRFAGSASFAGCRASIKSPSADVVVVGVPFDSGVSYRPGARFGPSHIEEETVAALRPYNPALDVSPFDIAQVADAGDIAANPFNIHEAIETIEAAALDLTADGASLVTIGGDHTIALPLLRAAANRHGPVALVHFDAHLDTWDTYFGAEYTHGTPSARGRGGHRRHRSAEPRRDAGPVVRQEGSRGRSSLRLRRRHLVRRLLQGVVEIIDKLRQRVGDRPVYVSIDIDVWIRRMRPVPVLPRPVE